MRSIVPLRLAPLRLGPLGAGLAVALVALSCGDEDGHGGGPDAGDTTLARAQALAHLGQNVILPTYRAFAAEADGLVAAVDAYAAMPGAETRAGAQDAWRRAMAAWQEAELMQVGPAGVAGSPATGGALGGEDLRDEIYAWPLLNLCVIDQRTAGELHGDADALGAHAVNERGLGAIEYLIFVEGSDNNCSALSGINADGTWDSFTPEQIEQRRARHAHSLALVVQRRGQELLMRWEPSGGDFLAELTDPARSGALYGSAQEGLNAISDAMFYLDKETKDMKLAAPASILDCVMVTCGPGARESRFADASKAHVIANLRALQRLYLGGEPGGEEPSFDDLLRELGAGTFADTMATHIADAIGAVEAIEGTLAEALAANPESVVAAHAAVKLVTDDLKTMFLTVLDLALPMRAAGDTD